MEELKAYESASVLGLTEEWDAATEGVISNLKDKAKDWHKGYKEKKLAKDLARAAATAKVMTMEEYKSTYEPRVKAAIKEIQSAIAPITKQAGFSIKLEKINNTQIFNYGNMVKIPIYVITETTENQQVAGTDRAKLGQAIRPICEKYSLLLQWNIGDKEGKRMVLAIPYYRVEGAPEFDWNF